MKPILSLTPDQFEHFNASLTMYNQIRIPGIGKFELVITKPTRKFNINKRKTETLPAKSKLVFKPYYKLMENIV